MSREQEDKIRNFLKSEEKKAKEGGDDKREKPLSPMYGRVVYVPSSGEVAFYGSMMRLDAKMDDDFFLDRLCSGARAFWGTTFAVYCLESEEIFVEKYDGKKKIFEGLNRKLKDTSDIVSSAGDAGISHIERVNSGKEINPAGESRRFRIPKEDYRGPAVVCRSTV